MLVEFHGPNGLKALFGGALALIINSELSVNSANNQLRDNTEPIEYTEDDFLFNRTDAELGDFEYIDTLSDLWTFYESRIDELDLFPFDSNAGLCFVSGDSTSGTPTGNSWDTAFQSLSECIDKLDSTGNGGEIWVSGDQSLSNNPFVLRNNIRIYGGFDGTESERTQRDWNRTPSILSSDDRVLESVEVSGVLIDGFIIQSRSQSEECSLSNGGGLYAVNSDISIVNTVFYKLCAETGGAMYCQSGSPGGDEPEVLSGAPTILNSAFIGNRAVRNGGAIAAISGCNLFVRWVRFENNSASKLGGAVLLRNGSAPYFRASHFTANYVNHSVFRYFVFLLFFGIFGICYFLWILNRHWIPEAVSQRKRNRMPLFIVRHSITTVPGGKAAVYILESATNSISGIAGN